MARMSAMDAAVRVMEKEGVSCAFGKETCYVSTIGLSQIAAAQFLHVYHPRHWINCGQAGPLGWTIPAALGVCVADPERQVVAISGDYDFQFMIEERAVGAQFNLPYLHIVVNNPSLGLIRQSQRGFEMDYCVQLSFDNINAPDLKGYGVDHMAMAEGLGCKQIRVSNPEEIQDAHGDRAFARAIPVWSDSLPGRDRGPPAIRLARAGADPRVRDRGRKNANAKVVPIESKLL